MKLQMKTAELVRALYRVQGIADKKSAMPVLSHVLLSTHAANEVSVSATDNDIYLTGSYLAQVEVPGRVAVHARQFYDVVKAISCDSITLSRQDNHWVDVRAGNSHFHLAGMDADAFPEFPQPPHEVNRLKASAGTLSTMIDRTLFCVSTDENRHHLSGIYMATPTGIPGLRMVATDGHRLALAEGALQGEARLGDGVIVPRKGLQELKRLLGDDAEALVDIAVSGTNCVFSVGTAVLSTRLIEGQFPDYEQVIPKKSTKQAQLARTGFAEALRRVSLLSQGRAHGVRFEFEGDSLHLVAEDPKAGDAQEDLPLKYSGEPLLIGFNARYVLDVLALIPEQNVRFELSDDLSPGVLRPLDDEQFLAIVMPMRI